MTPNRWFPAAAGLGVLAMLLSLSLDLRRAARTDPSDSLAGPVRQLASAASDARSAVHAYRSAQALDRWKRAVGADPAARTVRFDETVPRAIADSLLEAVRVQWSQLDLRAPRKAEVFVFVDSSTIPRVSAAGSARPPIESVRPVDVSYALPEVTDGERCVVLVRLRGTSPAHVAAVHAEPLTGVCGFYGAFGLPGVGVRSWLWETGHAFARRSDWDVARAPVIEGTLVYSLDPDGARCLAGKLEVCRIALGVSSDRGADVARPRGAHVSERVLSAVAALSPRSSQPPRGGDRRGQFLADVVRDLGPERFTRFWQSDSTLEVAFTAAAGVELETWTGAWFGRTYGAVTSRPSVSTRDVVWLAVVAPLLLIVAARPREQLLVETLRRRSR